MSELARIYATPQPEGVNWHGYRLCRGCSRQMHTDHSATDACACDLCGNDEGSPA